MKCVMCQQESSDLDFMERCPECFRKYLDMPLKDRPKLGIPFTPISKAVK